MSRYVQKVLKYFNIDKKLIFLHAYITSSVRFKCFTTYYSHPKLTELLCTRLAIVFDK